MEAVEPPVSSATRAPLIESQDLVGDRARLVSIGMLAVFIACVVFAALRLGVAWQTGRATPWWGSAFGAAAIALLYAWFRGDRARRSSIGVHGTALVATIALLVPAIYGMNSQIRDSSEFERS